MVADGHLGTLLICRKRSVTKMIMTSGVVPVINLVATGENIVRLRKAAGISVRDLQEVMGFTNPQAIYKWQNGESLPSIDNLIILAAVLCVSIDEILVVEGAPGSVNAA